MENEIVEAVCKAPQLLKLGIALEFRDALNKTAIQLLKNLDRSKCSITECLQMSHSFQGIQMFLTKGNVINPLKNKL